MRTGGGQVGRCIAALSLTPARTDASLQPTEVSHQPSEASRRPTGRRFQPLSLRVSCCRPITAVVSRLLDRLVVE